MTSENPLVITNKALSLLEENNPASKIDTARRINERVNEMFEINGFLTELNKRLFGNKGEIRPIYQVVSIEPEVPGESEGESRFKKLFTLRYTPGVAALGAELFHKKEKPQYSNDPFWGVGIKVYQTVNIADETFDLFILGKLYFSTSRSSSGRWNNSPTTLRAQSQGRYLTFSFNSIPPAEDIKTAFWENTLEILGDLSVGNFIPSIDLNTENNQRQEDTTLDI